MVSCAKTAEPIGMLFAIWALMGLRNNVLDRGPDILKKRAILEGKSGPL